MYNYRSLTLWDLGKWATNNDKTDDGQRSGVQLISFACALTGTRMYASDQLVCSYTEQYHTKRYQRYTSVDSICNFIKARYEKAFY